MKHYFSLIIVDDEPTILSGLSELYPWHDWGFELAGAYISADTALSALRTHPIDAVLTDIRMPGLDGLNFAAILAKEFPLTRVVLLSAYTDFEYARQSMRAGVAAYLVKPVRYEQLFSTFVMVYNTLIKITSRCAVTPSDESADAYYGQIVQYVRSYVEQNPANATLEGVAHALGFTAGHISRVFHKTSGQTFSQYLTSQRMAFAARMLSGPYPSIKDVAYWVGYESVKNFSKAFERYFGVTPTQYATSQKEE